MTITPSQTTINSRRDKVENKGDLIKTIVSDLYGKQADILRLKQEMDAEYFVHESAGGACYSNSSADLKGFEKVSIYISLPFRMCVWLSDPWTTLLTLPLRQSPCFNTMCPCYK